MKYFIGFLITVGLIVLMFILLFNNFSAKNTKTQPTSVPKVAEYAVTDTEVRMRVEGKVIAEQEHTAYQITVGRSAIRLETFRGYDSPATETRTYNNTQEGYANFLRALDFAGYMKGDAKANEALKDDKGACAIGRRFIFEVVSGSAVNQRYWSSNCRAFRGTYQGNSEETKRLFDRQVPMADFNKLVNSLNL